MTDRLIIVGMTIDCIANRLSTPVFVVEGTKKVFVLKSGQDRGDHTQ